MNTPKIIPANILSAFSSGVVVGTKVLDHEKFLQTVVAETVAAHDFSADRVPGQGYIPIPESAFGLVSAGVGHRTADPKDYVLTAHRGRVNAYLRRERAAEVESLACIVYTRAAYLADPEVVEDKEEFERISNSDATHILVAVLAAAGPKAPLTPHRFVSNLAGGNREAAEWTAEEIRTIAKDVLSYDNEWVVVADDPMEIAHRKEAAEKVAE